MFAAGLSPDGRSWVAVSSWGGTILRHEINAEDGKLKVSRKGKSLARAGELPAAEFTSDGKQKLPLPRS